MGYFIDYIIDKQALTSNLKQLVKQTYNCKICAVVKANAYGVGVEHVCSVIKNYVDCFAVANVLEAKEIRTFDQNMPILILGLVDEKSLEWCSKNEICISVFSYEQLQNLVQINISDVLKIHIKINSGLNRFGVKDKNTIKKMVDLISGCSHLALAGVYSHFATKQEDAQFIKHQFEQFIDCIKPFKDLQIIKHISNSYATLFHPEYKLDMVRVGLAMYGEVADFKKVITIKTQIVNIIKIKAGDSVGYMRSFKANKSMKIAVVPMGYGDGLCRALSNNFYLLVEGIKCKIVGKICMDCCMIDITKVKNAFVGTEVVVGKSKENYIALKDYSDALHTSVYEILANFDRKRMNKKLQ